MKNFISIISISGILIFSVFFTISCSDNRTDDDLVAGSGEVLTVFVNIPPQAYFVQRIGGDLVDVEILVPPGRDPHDFTPTPRIVMKLGAADLYFHGLMPFGLELARKVEGAGAGTRIVDITDGIDLRSIDDKHEGGHDHCDHVHCHEHGHEGMDPHVWLSPPEIIVQAENIAAALKEQDPDNASEYADNLAVFLQDLEEIDDSLKSLLEPYRGHTIYVYHPAFGYFASRYGLRQAAVETGGRSPSPRHLRELIGKAKEEGVKVIFVQPQFEGRSAQAVAEAIEGKVVPLDPLAWDVLENLLLMGEKIAEALADTADDN